MYIKRRVSSFAEADQLLGTAKSLPLTYMSRIFLQRLDKDRITIYVSTSNCGRVSLMTFHRNGRINFETDNVTEVRHYVISDCLPTGCSLNWVNRFGWKLTTLSGDIRYNSGVIINQSGYLVSDQSLESIHAKIAELESQRNKILGEIGVLQELLHKYEVKFDLITPVGT